MKLSFFVRTVTIVLLALVANTRLKAQIATEEKLLGCWKFSKLDNPEPEEGSKQMDDEMKGHTVCFEKNGKFSARKVIGDQVTPIGTGTFSIRADGKTIDQKRDADDGGIDESGEVVALTEDLLSIKFGSMIMHLKRVSK